MTERKNANLVRPLPPPDRENIDSAGAVVFRSCRLGEEALMIVIGKSRYSFPKGHVEPGETLEQTALREVREETGADIRIVADFCYSVPSARKEDDRQVHFFLGVLENEETGGALSGDENAEWYPVEKARHLISYEPDRKMFEAAIEIWLSYKQNGQHDRS